MAGKVSSHFMIYFVIFVVDGFGFILYILARYDKTKIQNRSANAFRSKTEAFL
jgi:hypothetical protein